ncbi:MAG: type II toxin-antitoxin system VapC family toxin [Myxococcaceae bacterium]
MTKQAAVTDVVLDASALLALLNEEPGAALVEEAVTSGAIISAVNLAEVATKLTELGANQTEISNALDPMSLRVVPFDATLAYATAALRPASRRFGLSLGDRACLALGLSLRATVLTTDRAWNKLGLQLAIRLVR